MKNFSERQLRIRTADKHVMYGNLVSVSKPKGLVIFVHGFTGNKNEHQFFSAAKYALEKGYDSFRFDFYNDQKGARHFEDTALLQHADDVNRVISHFASLYKKIYLVGHSFGGTTLCFVDTSKVSGLVFWDAPFIIPQEEKTFFEKQKRNGQYYVDWGLRVVVGKKYINELYAFPDCGEAIAGIRAPMKFIAAGSSKIVKKLFSAAKAQKSFHSIKGADHIFGTLAAEQELLEETFNWIKTI
jgi:pimeloyl-ACP methyl ester carboxylesterase